MTARRDMQASTKGGMCRRGSLNAPSSERSSHFAVLLAIRSNFSTDGQVACLGNAGTDVLCCGDRSWQIIVIIELYCRNLKSLILVQVSWIFHSDTKGVLLYEDAELIAAGRAAISL